MQNAGLPSHHATKKGEQNVIAHKSNARQKEQNRTVLEQVIYTCLFIALVTRLLEPSPSSALSASVSFCEIGTSKFDGC